MNPVLIPWASRSGNTELLAQRILERLEAAGIPSDLRPVKTVDWSQKNDWSAMIAGSPTYGAGDLHPDWDRPERALRDLSLEGWPVAVFGCGNPRYVTPWWGVDILENRFRNQGAHVLVPSYKANTLEGFRVRDADPWIDALAVKLLSFLGNGLHEVNKP